MPFCIDGSFDVCLEVANFGLRYPAACFRFGRVGGTQRRDQVNVGPLECFLQFGVVVDHLCETNVALAIVPHEDAGILYTSRRSEKIRIQ